MKGDHGYQNRVHFGSWSATGGFPEGMQTVSGESWWGQWRRPVDTSFS